MSDGGNNYARPRPSEFDLRPTERELDCGCYIEQSNGVWRITGQAFLCPEDHRLYDVYVEEPRV